MGRTFIIGALAAVLVLGACARPEQVLAKRCTVLLQQNNPGQCTCIADQITNDADPAEVKALVTAFRTAKTQEELLTQLTPSQALKLTASGIGCMASSSTR